MAVTASHMARAHINVSDSLRVGTSMNVYWGGVVFMRLRLFPEKELPCGGLFQALAADVDAGERSEVGENGYYRHSDDEDGERCARRVGGE